MRITTRGRYALRASLALAKLGKKGAPVSINSLSEEENISSVFLEQIFFKLKKAEIVTSIRGPGGGFHFNKSLEELTVLQILEASGENLDITFCDKKNDNCDRIGECLSHCVWVEANEIVKKYFSSITLASILNNYGEFGTDYDAIINANPAAEKHE
jgi:Rrf2 family iron-sulfur cluster assembly transcriptional regulator